MKGETLTLAIFSDCIHQYDPLGNVVTENHIFCRQMEAIASFYKQTDIYCPFTKDKSKGALKQYTLQSVRFHPLPNVGGNTLKDKLKIAGSLPAWWRAYKRAAKTSDIVYQRFPNNLNIPGALYFYAGKKKVFATYTGTWDNYSNEPATYRFQKWFLRKYFRGPVGVYFPQATNDTRIKNTYSPSYSEVDWQMELQQVDHRIQKMRTKLQKPVFVSVGALVKNKNQAFILTVFKILQNKDFPFHLYIAGDGPLLQQYSEFIKNNGLEQNITLTGRVGEEEIRQLYRKADFLIQAPIAEGYGKVPVEGFFHGVIPLLSNTAMATEMTGHKGERGFVFSLDDPEIVAAMIEKAVSNEADLCKMIVNGRTYARNKTLEAWAKESYETVCNYYNLSDLVGV